MTMILFLEGAEKQIYAVKSKQPLQDTEIQKLEWLMGQVNQTHSDLIPGLFIGPRVEMISPWSTNAVEITQNMGIHDIDRIEEFYRIVSEENPYDRMIISTRGPIKSPGIRSL